MMPQCSSTDSSGTSLPAKLFYDAEGCRLFDRICELEEYYPTHVQASPGEELLRVEELSSPGRFENISAPRAMHHGSRST